FSHDLVTAQAADVLEATGRRFDIDPGKRDRPSGLARDQHPIAVLDFEDGAVAVVAVDAGQHALASPRAGAGESPDDTIRADSRGALQREVLIENEFVGFEGEG